MSLTHRQHESTTSAVFLLVKSPKPEVRALNGKEKRAENNLFSCFRR